MLGVANGTIKKIDLRGEFGVGIDLSVPPYPLSIEPDLYGDTLLNGFNKENLRHTWFYDVYKKDGRFL